MGDSENFQMDNIPTFEEKGQECEKQAPRAQKESCWNCYKLFSREDKTCVNDTESKRTFCSQVCFSKHQE